MSDYSDIWYQSLVGQKLLGVHLPSIGATLGTGELVEDFKLLSISIETFGECGDEVLRCLVRRCVCSGLGHSRFRSGKFTEVFLEVEPDSGLRGGRGLRSGTS